jgi:hypothetical protein
VSNDEVCFATEPEGLLAAVAIGASEASMTVCDSRQGWGIPHEGVRLLGCCSLSGMPDRDRAAYAARFPKCLVAADPGGCAPLDQLALVTVRFHTIHLAYEIAERRQEVVILDAKDGQFAIRNRQRIADTSG